MGKEAPDGDKRLAKPINRRAGNFSNWPAGQIPGSSSTGGRGIKTKANAAALNNDFFFLSPPAGGFIAKRLQTMGARAAFPGVDELFASLFRRWHVFPFSPQIRTPPSFLTQIH